MKKRKFSVILVMMLLALANIGFFQTETYGSGPEVYVAAADSGGNSNYILSNGDGTFSSQEYMGQIPQPYYSYGCGIGDFDNDGDFDYVIGTGYSTFYHHHIYLYEKLGPGNDFASPVSVDTWTEGYYPMDFAVADYNNDGNMDFVLTHYMSSNSELYLGNGDLTFTRSVLTDTSPYDSIGADSEDFNNDGYPDFVATQYGSPAIEDLPYNGTNPYYIYVNLGNGDGTFTATSFEAASSAWGATAADFDNDGNADIISGGMSTIGWYFYQGNGDGTFQSGVAITDVTSDYSPIDNYDFDGDGDQDIIMGYQYSARYYSGNGDGTFTYITEIGGGGGGYRYCISAPSAEIIPGSPRAIASPEWQYLPLEGGTAHFNGTASYDEDGEIVSYFWEFGDGYNATGAIVSHNYSEHPEETTYCVRLTVTDNETKKDCDSVIVRIGNTSPKVVCVPWRYGLAHETWNGNPAVLKATVKDMDLPLTYTWDFGDATSENGTITNEAQKYAIEATHTYPDAAEWTPFTATLTVWDPYGASGSDTYRIVVKTKTLDVEVNVAIDDGLWWLHKQAYRYTFDGIDYARWSSYSTYYTSPTAESVLAFEIQGHQPIGDPGEDPYVETVQRGLNYVFSQTRVVDISAWGSGTSSPYGDPDTNGNDIGIGISSGQEVYEIGIAMMAIAASGDPDLTANTGPTDVVGRTYKDILTDMVDICAWGQNDYGGARGGWRYGWNYGSSDNSVSQWPMMALEAAETNWGIMVADFVKTELDTYWLTYSQNADGSFGYSGPGGSNIARTGTGIIGLNYVGLPADNPRIVNAVNWLGNHWSEFGNYYGMYAVMKGMRTANPEITVVGTHDWYAEYAQYLVNNQQADSGWPDYYGRVLATDWAILILTTTVIFPPPIADAGPDITWGPDWPGKFDGSRSYHLDPAKTIVLYEWDFESDGVYDFNSTDPYAEHVYPTYYNPDDTINETLTYRDYTVTLRVTDDNVPAKTDTDTCIVHITPPPHPPIADPNGPYVGYQYQLISLDGTRSFDIDSGSPWFDYIVSYGWELDMVWPYDFDDAFGATVQWSWDVVGTSDIGLRVEDTTGLTHTAWTTVTIAEMVFKCVSVDIKPASWPNPINKAGEGAFAVAICGTEDFDVTTIDPTTVRIYIEGVEEGVSPIRWAYEDVATPYTGESGGGHALGGDGYLDLVMHFDTQEVVNTLELCMYAPRETIILIIRGNLYEAYAGTPIQGQDYVWILEPARGRGGGHKTKVV